MPRKSVTTRSALITTTAMMTATTVGGAAATITGHLGYTGPGIGPAVTAIVAVWMLDKLDTLIDDTK